MGTLTKRQSLHRQAESAAQTNRQLQEQLRQSQALSGLGLAWSITAHEINNLLTPLTNYARLALAHPDDAQLSKKAHEKAALLGQRAADILEKIMAMAAGKPLEKSRIEVNALFDDVLLCIGRDFAKDGIQIVRNCPAGVAVWGDRVMLSQAMMTLTLNARRAMLGKGGRLTLSAQATQNGTRIAITDTGCGMTQEVLSQIFEPFYTTNASASEHRGNGLGLVFCRHIVDAHDGGIQVDSEPGRGTTFTLLLPDYPQAG